VEHGILKADRVTESHDHATEGFQHEAFLYAGREEFLDEYGPVSDESLLRARVLALDLNAVLARYGRAERQRRIEGEALAGLARAASA